MPITLINKPKTIDFSIRGLSASASASASSGFVILYGSALLSTMSSGARRVDDKRIIIV